MSEDAVMPGAWVCPKCGFALQRNVLSVADGGVYADTTKADLACPNDGELMQPLTWRKVNEDLFKDVLALRAENKELLDELAALRAKLYG